MNALQKSLEDIYNAMPKNDSFFNCMDKKVYNNDKYQKKLNNAMDSYVGWDNIAEDEAYLFLFDDTIFGSAKDGFLITTQAMYYKEQMENPQKELFSDITSISIKSVDKIVIDATMINLTLANLDRDSIVKILNVLKDYNNISKDDLLVEKSITISADFASSGGVYPEAINGHEIKIPADTTDGKRWRYEGLGNTKLGVCGDLIIAVTVEAFQSIQTLKDMDEEDSNNIEIEIEMPDFTEFMAKDDNQGVELTLETPPETSQQQTNPSDLKTQYANKIASGEIDPIETSFADFEAASKNKEIDYKAVYSQMIGEGRIDPTETSYEEMILVSKLFGGVDESEYKTTYSKYIGSGEIDPSETTYDEIVSIAKIFNEINGGSFNGGAITKEQLITELKTFIETLEDEDEKEYCNNSLNTENFWEMMDYFDDENSKRKVFEYYESIANTSADYQDIAQHLEWDLGDTEKSIRTFKLAQEKIEDCKEALSLAEAIVEADYIDDKEWVRKIYEKALILADNNFEDLDLLGYKVAQEDGLNDKSWGRDIFQKAYQVSNSVYNLTELANSVMSPDVLSDWDWAQKLLQEALSKTDTFEDYILVLHRVLDDDFNDRDWAYKIIEILLTMAQTAKHYNDLIIQISEINKDLATDLVYKAIMVMENDDEKDELAGSVDWNIENEELAEEIKNSSIEELKTKYTKPSTDELKKLYAQGIGSGEIDPVEVSFDSFEKSYGISNTNSTLTANENYNELLIEAAENNDVSLAQKCLDVGADINYTTNDDSRTSMWTPLLYAAWDGHLEVGKLLVDNGADLKVTDRKGYRAHDLALSDGNPYGQNGNQQLSDYIWDAYVERHGAWG